MSNTSLTFTDGFPTYVLRSAALEVRVVPALGAKIISLRDLRSGREWLAPPPDRRPLAEYPPGTAFELGPLTGIDECFPTVSSCVTEGRSLPDHGSAWTAAWTVDEAAWEAGCLRTTVALEDETFLFERELTLKNDTLHFSYQLTNRAPSARAWLWAFHPILAIEKGDCIILPTEVKNMRVAGAFNLDMPIDPNGCVAWPSPAEGINFEAIKGPAAPWSAKLFCPTLCDGRAAIANKTQATSLSFEFNPSQSIDLAVWITRGGWNGYHHVALEPTTFSADTPQPHLLKGGQPVLGSGEKRSWSLKLVSGASGLTQPLRSTGD
jgi:galactose mutarotase-like enzyme